MSLDMSNVDELSRCLFDAVEKGNFDEFKSLMEEDDASSDLCNETGMTLLMQAAYNGQLEMCKYLLDHGANVNKAVHDNKYTALMMAGVAGKADVVILLLNCGANVQQKNSINKTPIELASFVGQHECANLMKNFLSLDKLEPYYTSQGDNDPRLTKTTAAALQKLLANTNPHPVKIVLSVMDSPELYNATILNKAESILQDFCGKCVRSKNDFDEVLALKVYYYSSILALCKEYMMKQDRIKLDGLVKQFLRSDGDGFPVAVETIIRKSLLGFSFPDLPLMQHFIRTIHPVKIGSDPTSFSCLLTMFNGMHSASKSYNMCEACGTNASSLRCSACKQVCYCSKRCQKFHWFDHKKLCKTS